MDTISSGQDGIQQLLIAEQEAQIIVANARKAKTERLKQAKDEAEKEILSYKAEKEAEFQRKMSDDTSISHDNALKMAQQADTEVSQVRDSVGQKRQNVLDLLIKHVRSVKF